MKNICLTAQLVLAGLLLAFTTAAQVQEIALWPNGAPGSEGKTAKCRYCMSYGHEIDVCTAKSEIRASVAKKYGVCSVCLRSECKDTKCKKDPGMCEFCYGQHDTISCSLFFDEVRFLKLRLLNEVMLHRSTFLEVKFCEICEH